MKYFVTGATGFLGGELARQLIAASHHVVALVRTPSKADALRALGATLAEGDITDAASLRAPMTGVDGVFHCAAWYKIGLAHSDEASRINVDGTRNVLHAMGELRVPKGVYAEGLRVLAGVTYLGSNAKARREVGYAPRPLEEGLRQTLAHEMRQLGMSGFA